MIHIFFYTGYYFTSDFAHRDADGDYKIIARMGDVIKCQGVCLPVTEIESAMVCLSNFDSHAQLSSREQFLYWQSMSDDRVMEACLVGYRHENHGRELGI